MLEKIVDSVPEGLEKAYVKQDDGKFHLDYQDDSGSKVQALETKLEASKLQVNEFRDNNRKLFNDKQELLNNTGDVSPEVLTELNDLRTAKETSDSQLGTVKEQLEKVVLTDSVSTAAIKHGVSETALVDVVSRAKQAFNVVEGKAIHVSEKFESVDAWMKDLSESANHLFKESTGANTPRSVNGKVNPTMSSVQKITAGLNK